MTSAASDLLQFMSYYRTGSPDVATQRPEEEVYSKLLTNYYGWRLAIFERCKLEERQRLSKVGEQIEQGTSATLRDLVPTLASEVHDLTRLAASRIR